MYMQAQGLLRGPLKAALTSGSMSALGDLLAQFLMAQTAKVCQPETVDQSRQLLAARPLLIDCLHVLLRQKAALDCHRHWCCIRSMHLCTVAACLQHVTHTITCSLLLLPSTVIRQACPSL